MAKLSHKNLNQASPSWLVNVTAAIAVLTVVMPGLIEKLPGNVSELTKDWLQWIMEAITALLSVLTALSKKQSQ